MASKNVEFKVIGLPGLLRKLDAGYLTEPARRRIISRAGGEARDFLNPRIPRRTGASAARLTLTITDEYAKLTLPRYPLRFPEFGTIHQPKQRFMAKTIGRTRSQIKRTYVPDAEKEVKGRWGAS